MQKVSLTTLKKEYISVDGSYGGNQRWLRMDADKPNTLSNYGCGLISVNDILLHISDQPNITSKEKYIAAIRDMNRRYFHVLPFLGLSGIMMSFYLKIYLFMHGKHFKSSYKVKWGVLPHNILTKIKEMLDHDIPVTLSIGPCLIRGRKKELPLYTLEYQTEKSDAFSANENTGFEKNEVNFCQVNSVKDHYVNVTGIYHFKDNVENSIITMLEISSWGKKFYINYDEYINFVKKYDNFLFSNILYIRPKR